MAGKAAWYSGHFTGQILMPEGIGMGVDTTAAEPAPKQLSQAQDAISEECDAIKRLLLEKNHEYGNSALEPINVFSGATALEQINVRIDDKLKRIQTIRQLGEAKIPEDTEQDLIGYLILKRVARRLEKAAEIRVALATAGRGAAERLHGGPPASAS